MSRRRGLNLLVLGLGALVCGALVPNGTALAASANCGTGGGYHDYLNGIDPVPFDSFADGIQADIEIRFPNICGQGVTRYVLGSVLIGRNSATIRGWAQIGWMRSTDLCCLRYFWQWVKDDNSNVYTAFWGNPDVGTKVNFKVTRLAEDGHLNMFYGNPDQMPPCNQAFFCPETDFDPHILWSSQHAEVFAESSHPGNDMPGTLSNKAAFDAIKTRPLNTGWSAPYNWSQWGSDRPCYWRNDANGEPTLFLTWTNPTAHGTTC
jgi:hypothetical protein